MLVPGHPDRRFLVAVDMESYSRQDNLRQYQSQRTLRAVMEQAAGELRLDRPRWTSQPTGDGEVAVLPAGTSEPAVVSRLAPTIDRLLRTHNQSLIPEAKVRLRVAFHQGLVHLDSPHGFAAEAVVTVCRLLDATPLKRALAAFPSAATALIVSDELFRDVVRQQYDGMRPDRFRKVTVDLPAKGFRQSAWICVPDEDVNRLERLDDPEPDPGDVTMPPDREPVRPSHGSAAARASYLAQGNSGPLAMGPGAASAHSISFTGPHQSYGDRR